MTTSAWAATYTLPGGPLPGGCSTAGSTVTCGAVNLGNDDKIVVTEPTTLSLAGLDANANNIKINAAGTPDSLTIVTSGNIVIKNGGVIHANIQAIGNISIKNNGEIVGSISGDANITIGINATVTGDISSGGNVTIENNATITGNISSGGNVSIGSNVTITGSVAADGDVSIGMGSTVMGGCLEYTTTPVNSPACQSVPVGGLNHVRIEHTGVGGACTGQTLTFKACADAACATLASAAVSVTLSPTNGTWVLLSGGSLSGSSLTIHPGTAAVLNFDSKAAGLINYSVGGAAYLCDNTTDGIAPNATTQCRATVYTNEFKVESNDTLGTTGVSGRPHGLKVTAYLKQGNTCSVATSYTGTKNVSAWYIESSGLPSTPAAPGIATSPQCTEPTALPAGSFSLAFVNGIASSLYLCTSDVGKFTLYLRDAVVPVETGDTPAITFRPFAFRIAVPGATLPSTSPTDPVFKKAGGSFGATVTAVNWQLADDANNDGTPDAGASLSDNATASGFSAAVTLSTDPTVGSYRPTGGTLGSLSNGAIASTQFTGGAASVSNLSYSEVGSFTLLATSTNFLGITGANVSGSFGPLGRFVPNHFETVITGPMVCSTVFSTGCPVFKDGATLSDHLAYAGQTFSTKVTAYSLSGGAGSGITRNYAGSFARQVTLGAYDGIGSATAAAGGALTGNTLAAGDFVNGEATGSPSFSFAATPSAPMNIYLRATEDAAATPPGDGATSKRDTNPATTSVEGGIRIVSGRMIVENMYGPPTTRLLVKSRAMYWDGAKWVANTADTASGAVTSNFTRSPTSTCPSPDFCGIGLLSAKAKAGENGAFELMLTPPTSGAGRRSVIVQSALPYLAGSGRQTFGTFRAPYIYQRER